MGDRKKKGALRGGERSWPQSCRKADVKLGRGAKKNKGVDGGMGLARNRALMDQGKF